MSKVTLPQITSVTNEESFIAQLNVWREAIQNWSDLVLSRNGQTPNVLTADLDLNSFRILNTPAPVDDNDLVRLVDVAEGIKGDQGEQGPSGGPISDGDYGDIVATGGGTILTIDSTLLPTYGRILVANASAADARTDLGLGNSATKSIGVSAGDVAGADDTRFDRYTINIQDNAYTLQATDKGKLVRHTSATPHTYTLENIGVIDYPLGTVILIRNAVGAGVLTIARGATVILYPNGSNVSANLSLASGAVCSLVHEATNIWVAMGPGIS